MLIRDYCPADCAQIVRVFYEAVHQNRNYTRAQRAAWAPCVPDEALWHVSLSTHYTVVAEADGRVIGFGDLAADGYLDRLFVLPAWQRRGAAGALCDALERHAAGRRITVHASLTARPFFERRGYRVLRAQEVERRGVRLTNFVMEKPEGGGQDAPFD